MVDEHMRTKLVNEPSPHRAWLVVRAGCKPLGNKFDLRPRNTKIGRGSSCAICLDEESVSHEHAKLIYRGHGHYSIIDLGSLNHTLVNGTTIQDTLLSDGDVITVGRVELVFKCVR